MKRAIKLPRRQAGFAYIAAVVLLVVVAGVIAATLRLTASQQATVDNAVLVARAGQAARGGVEWMMYQVGANAATPVFPAALCAETPNPPAAQVAPKETTLAFAKVMGFTVTVRCGYVVYNEGVDQAGAAVTKSIFTIDSVACNGAAGTCPDDASAGAPDYTERRRVATICMRRGGGAC